MSSDIGIPTSGGQHRCPHCGTGDVELTRTCHNSACSSYAAGESIYQGWRPAPHHPASVSVDTRFNAERIEQDLVYTNQAGDEMSRISLHILHLKDEGLRQALINLGWTPPPDQQ